MGGADDFTVAAMMADACDATGLDSFGDAILLEPLGALVSSILTEARLSDEELAGVRAQLVGILRNRLVAETFFTSHPEITERRLGSPLLVIAGGARTGTTVLHRLLGCDPGLATMKTWQVMAPMPPAGTGPGDPDPRPDLMRARFPKGSSPVHPMAADEPEEEVFYLQEAFACLLFHLRLYLPGYEQWLRTHDLTPAYDLLVDLLHLNEWRAGVPAGRPRVMKSPQYAHDIQVVTRRFPDAKIVFTHRDPIKYVGSFLSIHRGTRPGEYPGLDHVERSHERLEMLEYERDQVAAVRAAQPAERFFDVLYADLTRDPIAVVRRVYEFLDRPLTAEAETAMRAWLADNPQGTGGGHRYTLEEFGLDTAHVDRRFADYRERFSVPREGGIPG